MSPEPIEAGVAAYRDEMARLHRTLRKAARTPANVQRVVAVKNAEIAKLKARVASAQVSCTTLPPAIQAAEKRGQHCWCTPRSNTSVTPSRSSG